MSKKSVNADWIYIGNLFEILLRMAFHVTYIIGKDHLAKLKEREEEHTTIRQIYDRLLPFFEAFEKAYINWKSAKGYYKGATMRVENLQSELQSQRYAKWSAAVQWLYPKDSPEFAVLFPEGGLPFQKGARDTRIVAVKTLAQQLVDYPQLAHVKDDAQTFYELMESTRFSQQRYEQNIQNASDELHKQRQILVDEFYLNFLDLLKLNYKERPNVLAFWQVNLLRSKNNATENEETATDDNENIAALQREEDVPALDPETGAEM